MEAVNLKFICRLCAKEDRFCIEVFGEDGMKNNISKKIRLCLPVVIRESDDYPKQICLSCLNKLDTSYELYSGCVNAQSTIKRMMISLNMTPGQPEKLPGELPLEQTNLLARQLSSLTTNNPIVRAGPTFMMLLEKRTTEDPQQQSRMKIRKLQTENSRINESEQQSTTMEGNEDDEDDNADVDMGFDVGAVQEELLPSSSAEQQNMQAQKLALKHSKGGNSDNVQKTFEQTHINTKSNTTLITAIPSTTSRKTADNQLMLVHKTSQKTTQPQIYISNSVFGQQQGSYLERMLSDTLCSQPESNVQGHEQVHQSHALENTARVLPVNQMNHESVMKVHKKKSLPMQMNSMKPLPVQMNISKNKLDSLQTHYAKQTGPIVIASTNNILQQQNNVNTGTVETQVSTASGTHFVTLANTPAVTQKTASGHSKKCKCSVCYMSQASMVSALSATNTTTTTTTSSPIVNKLTQSSGSGQISIAISANSQIPQGINELGYVGSSTGPSILISSVTSAGVSSDDLENTNFNIANSSDNLTPAIIATNISSVGTISNIATIAPLGSTTSTTTNNIPTTVTTSSTTVTADSEDITFVDYQPGRNVQSNLCQYCNKYFPADIIMHHKTLHFRERFFCCVACGKNFRTEVGLENHRCETT